MTISAIEVRGGPRTAQGSAETLDREVLGMILDCAFAPGAPLSIGLEVDPTLGLEAKTIGSKRRADGSFEVRARLVNMSREKRTRIVELAHRGAVADTTPLTNPRAEE